MSRHVDRILKSSLIQTDTWYRVLLPDDYLQSEGRYAVLYLLHGLFGSFENWTDLTGLGEYIRNYRLIVVMPEGGDNWYTDTLAGEANESYLIRELLPEIDAMFRTVADRRGRAIVGNSMGGYGAFKFALKYPTLFSIAGSFSGAFHAPKLFGPSEYGNWDDLGPSVSRVFGNPKSRTRVDNDIEKILAGLTRQQIASLPYLYLDCGSQDGFLQVNREMESTLSGFGVSHEYHEFEGGHEWPYWDTRVPDLLDLVFRKLNISNLT